MLIAFLLFFLLTTPTSIYAQIINEFVPHPNEGNEWVEIYNNTDHEMVLDNWYIKDTNGSKKKFSTTISAYQFYLFDLGTDSYLNNTGDETVNLINASNQIIETIPYNGSEKGMSWSRQPDNLWCLTSPSQATVNNACPTPTTENTPIPSPLPTLTLTPTPSFIPSPTTIPSPTSIPSATPAPARLEIIEAPDSINPDRIFSVSIDLKNALPSTTYIFKPYDTLNSSKNYFYYQCQNSNWCHYTSSFTDLPKNTTDSSGNLKLTLLLKFDSTKDIPDQYASRLGVKFKVNSTDNWSDSFNIKVIEVIKPEASQKPSVTSTLTSTPKPSLTPSLTPSQTVTPSPSPQVLGSTIDITNSALASPTPVVKQSKSNSSLNPAPIILIFLGGSLLLFPSLYSFLKKGEQN